jgi:hypothetical protein
MQIIRGQLSPMYVQHEAIEAQKSMVGSPNHKAPEPDSRPPFELLWRRYR